MEIKILHRQGLSIREIARKLSLSRNTVKQHLRKEGYTSYQRTKNKPSKLGSYYEYIEQRVKSAKPKWIPAIVLFKEIKEQGYKGGITILRDYLAKLKPTKIEEKVIRFETGPAEQMQVDWIEFRKGNPKLLAFVATLSYSRASFVEFVNDEKLETLLSCHESCFEYFGGIPLEILYDNMKTVVIERNAYAPGKHKFNAKFYDFAKHYGFIPRLCKPYRAKTKGKVERFNGYLRYSFYYPLIGKLKLLGLKIDRGLANYEVKIWLRDIANQRIHSTTKEIPSLLLEQERQALQPIVRPYHNNNLNLYHNKENYFNNSFQHDLSIYDLLLQRSVS